MVKTTIIIDERAKNDLEIVMEMTDNKKPTALEISAGKILKVVLTEYLSIMGQYGDVTKAEAEGAGVPVLKEMLKKTGGRLGGE